MNPRNVALDSGGVLTFGNAAVDAGVAGAPGQGYRGDWYAFDNTTRAGLERLPAGPLS